MSARTALGILETAALAAVGELGGIPAAGYRKTTRVLQALEQRHGIGGRYAYPVLQDLCAPWRLHLPLLDGGGNWGSQHGDPPADARYTELRLTAVGALALAAEREEVGPVPLGLIEGSLYRDGPVPPFAPTAVVRALRTRSTDVGGPVLPSGGSVEGDIGALLAGRRCRLSLACTIRREDTGLVITEVPLGISVDSVAHNLQSRSYQFSRRGSSRLTWDASPPQPADAPGFEVMDIIDESTMRTGVRVRCLLTAGSDHAAAERWMRSVWPVVVEVDCQLPAPMRMRLKTWNGGDGSGLDRLEDLIDGEPP